MVQPADDMSEIKRRVSENIRQIRKKRGFTQKELALRLGVGEPTVNGYEGGQQNLTVETLQRIAEALDVDIANFFA